MEEGHIYRFYGSDHRELKTIAPAGGAYGCIRDPYDLYDVLLSVWSVQTCAPRLRPEWSADNPTLGQCSVTAFLAQDIFGGKVYGIRRPGGNYHCYNVVNGIAFDLTSEQFGDEKLEYTNNPEQFREVHFQKAEKKDRYELLKSACRARAFQTAAKN